MYVDMEIGKFVENFEFFYKECIREIFLGLVGGYNWYFMVYSLMM